MRAALTPALNKTNRDFMANSLLQKILIRLLIYIKKRENDDTCIKIRFRIDLCIIKNVFSAAEMIPADQSLVISNSE